MKRGLKVLPHSTSPCAVTTVTPMKRGLKDKIPVRLCSKVTTVTPMKRGLKEVLPSLTPHHVRVTTVTPMKRGLKASLPVRSQHYPPGYNRYPDEKGTESETWEDARDLFAALQPLPR